MPDNSKTKKANREYLCIQAYSFYQSLFFFFKVNLFPYWDLNLAPPTNPPHPFTTWARPQGLLFIRAYKPNLIPKEMIQ